MSRPPIRVEQVLASLRGLSDEDLRLVVATCKGLMTPVPRKAKPAAAGKVDYRKRARADEDSDVLFNERR